MSAVWTWQKTQAFRIKSLTVCSHMLRNASFVRGTAINRKKFRSPTRYVKNHTLRTADRSVVRVYVLLCPLGWPWKLSPLLTVDWEGFVWKRSCPFQGTGERRETLTSVSGIWKYLWNAKSFILGSSVAFKVSHRKAGSSKHCITLPKCRRRRFARIFRRVRKIAESDS